MASGRGQGRLALTLLEREACLIIGVQHVRLQTFSVQTHVASGINNNKKYIIIKE